MASKVSAVAVAAIALCGCVADETTQQGVRRAAQDAYWDCVVAAVKRLDNGDSDPASIAVGVAGACSGQYARLASTAVDEMSTKKGQLDVREQMRSEELRLATTAVLTYRASKNDPPR
jgi:hypothetical protein